VQYQLQITKRDTDSGFVLPVPSGLVNRVTLSLVNLDVDVFSPQAVSVQRSASSSNTVATLVLAPGSAWIGWKPRSRDVKSETPVFYAELSQLYVPSAGVVEGVHQVSIRPAQGELSELIFDVPAGRDNHRCLRWQHPECASSNCKSKFKSDLREPGCCQRRFALGVSIPTRGNCA